MKIESVVILVVMLIATLFDAARDAWVTRKWGVDWWRWHIVKWIAFFLPMILLSCLYFYLAGLKLVIILVFAGVCLICYVGWKVVYKWLDA